MFPINCYHKNACGTKGLENMTFQKVYLWLNFPQVRGKLIQDSGQIGPSLFLKVAWLYTK